MGPKERVRILFMLLVGGLLIASLWSVYRAYQATQYSPTFASALSTFTLVIITAWYAWSTRKLLGATQAQTEATRASFAPHLDARFTGYTPDSFGVDLVNRGQGVATDITIEARVYTSELGDFSVGDHYTFVAHVIPSLPPNTSLGGGPESHVSINPQFFLSVSEENMNQALNNPPIEHHIPDMGEDVAGYLSEYLSHEKATPKYPTRTGCINELLNLFHESEGMPHLPVLEVWVSYSDTLGGSKTYEDRICKARLNVEAENFEQAFTKMPTVISSRGFRRRLADYFMERGKRLRPSSPYFSNVTPPYETDIAASVERVDVR